MITRRTLLAATALSGLAGCRDTPPSASPSGPVKLSYGDDPSQIADLHLPPGDAKVPVAVVIHGGNWMSGYGKELAVPLAEDLARVGVAGYAIEYRRIGNGGGWPATSPSGQRVARASPPTPPAPDPA